MTDLSDMFRRGRNDSPDDDHSSSGKHSFPPSEAVRDDSSERGGDHRSSICRHLSVTYFGSSEWQGYWQTYQEGTKGGIDEESRLSSDTKNE